MPLILISVSQDMKRLIILGSIAALLVPLRSQAQSITSTIDENLRQQGLDGGIADLLSLGFSEIFSDFSILSWLIWWGMIFVGIIFVAYLFIAVGGKFLSQANKIAEKETAKAFGFGILVSIAVVFLTFFFAATIIGIPLAIVISLLSSLAVPISIGFSAIFIGKKISEKVFKKNHSQYLTTLLGAFIISFLLSVSVIGELFSLVISSFGFGVFAIYWNERKKLKKSSAVDNEKTTPSKGDGSGG